MNDHLTPAELLTTLKYCRGDLGGRGCIGCPNAVPGSEGDDIMCECRYSTTGEIIHLLEGIVNKNIN